MVQRLAGEMSPMRQTQKAILRAQIKRTPKKTGSAAGNIILLNTGDNNFAVELTKLIINGIQKITADTPN